MAPATIAGDNRCIIVDAIDRDGESIRYKYCRRIGNLNSNTRVGGDFVQRCCMATVISRVCIDRKCTAGVAVIE